MKGANGVIGDWITGLSVLESAKLGARGALVRNIQVTAQRASRQARERVV